jgi:hypothetical protein
VLFWAPLVADWELGLLVQQRVRLQELRLEPLQELRLVQLPELPQVQRLEQLEHKDFSL